MNLLPSENTTGDDEIDADKKLVQGKQTRRVVNPLAERYVGLVKGSVYTSEKASTRTFVPR